MSKIKAEPMTPPMKELLLEILAWAYEAEIEFETYPEEFKWGGPWWEPENRNEERMARQMIRQGLLFKQGTYGDCQITSRGRLFHLGHQKTFCCCFWGEPGQVPEIILQEQSAGHAAINYFRRVDGRVPVPCIVQVFQTTPEPGQVEMWTIHDTPLEGLYCEPCDAAFSARRAQEQAFRAAL